MRKSFIFLAFLLFSSLCRARDPSALQQSLTEHIHYQTEGKNRIGFLNIERDRPIDTATYLQVKFALEEFVREKPAFVILRLNTPGGEVFAAMKIAELLQELDAVHHIPVVAWIDNWALSAGAMLAYSCRYIAVSPQGLMGAAEPVHAGADGKMESAPEKIVSALRAEFASLAKTYGRNPLLAEAMVDKDVFLVRRGGEIVQLQQESEVKTDDVVITARGKLLTLDAEQLTHDQIADWILPQGTALKTEQWQASSCPVFALPFFDQIPNAVFISYQNWKIDFFAFLAHPVVSSLLMMGLLIGIYMEVNHPGFGLPGILALTSLGLILLSNFATATIDWLEVLLVVLGVLLVLAEVFVLPGFGVVGILGILFILFGLGAGMLPQLSELTKVWEGKSWNLETFALFDRLLYFVATLILALLIIALLSRFVTPRLLKRSPIIHQGDQEGNVAGLERRFLPAVGASGEALTPLRPGGKVVIENVFYDALTQGKYLEKGEKVVVVKIEGSAIIVAQE